MGWRQLTWLVCCLEDRESVWGHLGGPECLQGLLSVEEGRGDQSDFCGKDPACSAGSKDGARDSGDF